MLFACAALLTLAAGSFGPNRTSLVLSSQGEGEQAELQEQSDQPAEAPVLDVGDAIALEGTATTTAVDLRLTLSAPPTSTVTATYSTSDGTASAPDDYASVTGTAAFEPGVTTTFIALEIAGDALEEADERFYLDVLQIEGATAGDTRGGVTILDDDGSNEGRELPAEDSEEMPELDRTAPSIFLSTPSDTVASTGWYNRSTSGTDGVLVEVTAQDESGVTALSCRSGGRSLLSAVSSGSFVLTDGVHEIVCVATDGEGNRGAGPESTTMPALFKVDQTDPQLTCAAATRFFLRQPGAQVSAVVADGQSGPASSAVSGSADTSSVGLGQTADVTGSDKAGNSSTVECSYDVVYRFSGFESPISSSGTQEEQAGRTIPVKWRISDYFDVGVDDPASFRSLTSFSETCSMSRTGEVTEGSPGASDLKYQGDGRWHFNWKTSRSYSGQCRTMSLNLLDGLNDRVSFFKFR